MVGHYHINGLPPTTCCSDSNLVEPPARTLLDSGWSWKINFLLNYWHVFSLDPYFQPSCGCLGAKSCSAFTFRPSRNLHHQRTGGRQPLVMVVVDLWGGVPWTKWSLDKSGPGSGSKNALAIDPQISRTSWQCHRNKPLCFDQASGEWSYCHADSAGGCETAVLKRRRCSYFVLYVHMFAR